MSELKTENQVLEAIQELRRTRDYIQRVESALEERYGITAQELIHEVEGVADQQERDETQKLDFSLFFFSQDTDRSDIYRLLIEGATFADRNGFASVWVPERHFHPFGGPYPNPSVLAAALATRTKQIRIRAGSVVLPLHHPVEVVESWSVIDQLSDGRVDMAFVSGWNPDDFLFAPQHYENRKEVMYEGIETMAKLWRGESVSFANGVGDERAICTYPRPVQRDLPAWITCTGSLNGFVEAGRMGYDILTALLFQSVDELAEKIAAYRLARQEAGFDPETGRVALMLHTFVGKDEDEIEQVAKPAFMAYLESSVGLWKRDSVQLERLDERSRERLIEMAYGRYRQTASLVGTVDECRAMAEQVMAAGVTEIASLIDFGVEDDRVLESLHTLNTLRKGINSAPGPIIDDRPRAVLPDYQVVVPQPNSSARLRLFCLPYAGGAPTMFDSWPDALSDDIEVCALGIPTNCNTLSDLFDVLLPKLKPYLDRPFAFYGHSVGGFVAFELARKLRSLIQVEPEHLFIASQHAPHLPFPYPSLSSLVTPEGFEVLRALTPIYLPDRICGNEALLMRLLRPIIPAMEIQSDNYTYESDAPLTCPISVFGGTDDPVLVMEHLTAWQIHTSGDFAINMMDGGHMFDDTQWKQVIEMIAELSNRENYSQKDDAL